MDGDIKKDNEVNILFDFYQSLLTSKQQQYIELYYADDLSLGEISEQANVSRQAVYDNLKRTVNSLYSYENHLHLYDHFKKRTKLVDQMHAQVSKKYPNDVDLLAVINQLSELE